MTGAETAGRLRRDASRSPSRSARRSWSKASNQVPTAVDGGSLTVDLSLVPALGGTTFTVQVATGPSAHDANGDAFYANFHVSTVASVPSGGGGSLF